jgi:hypothetical protein
MVRVLARVEGKTSQRDEVSQNAQRIGEKEMSRLLRMVVGSSCIAGSALMLPEPSLANGRNGHLECSGHVYMFYRNGKCLDARDSQASGDGQPD